MNDVLTVQRVADRADVLYSAHLLQPAGRRPRAKTIALITLTEAQIRAALVAFVAFQVFKTSCDGGYALPSAHASLLTVLSGEKELGCCRALVDRSRRLRPDMEKHRQSIKHLGQLVSAEPHAICSVRRALRQLRVNDLSELGVDEALVPMLMARREAEAMDEVTRGPIAGASPRAKAVRL